MGKTGWEGTGGRADTARTDEGTDDGMKMGPLGGCQEQPVDKRRTVGETDGDGAGVAGAVSAQRTVGWMGMGHGEDK